MEDQLVMESEDDEKVDRDNDDEWFINIIYPFVSFRSILYLDYD